MPKVTFVKCARKDQTETIKKGDSYYWFKFRFGSKQCSTTYPKPWELTQSEFLSTLYQLQDEQQNFSADDFDELESNVETFIDDVRSLQDATQESFDNIPEQLQDAPTGELLTERIDGLESWIGELENFDFENDVEEPEEPECEVEYPELNTENPTKEEQDQFDADYKEAEEAEEEHAEAMKEYETKKEEYEQESAEKLEEKVSDFTSIECEI